MGREPLIIIISSRRFQWINVPADLDFPHTANEKRLCKSF